MQIRLASKRHAREGRRAALIPVPGGLGLLLELVNLLPIHLRHPYWAQREQARRNRSAFGLQENDILNWRFEEESTEAQLARWLDKEVPDEWRTNSSRLLWIKLTSGLQELPIALQAFVLRDEQGNEVQVDGRTSALGVPQDLQSWRNLAIIGKSERDLKQIAEEASKRIDKSIDDELSGKRFPRIPDLDHPDALLERVRQRLILVLGLQELLSYVIQPERRDDMFFATTYYASDAARSHFYIDKDGKIIFAPPPVVRFLEGIEAARIRECSVCFKFFWAGRKDMRCCSTKCSNAGRMRRYRNRYYVKPINAKHDSESTRRERSSEGESTDADRKLKRSEGS